MDEWIYWELLNLYTHAANHTQPHPLRSIFHTIAYAKKLQPHRAIVW